MINRDDYLNEEQLASFLAFPNVQAMKYQLGDRLAPDTVFERERYWSKETATEYLEARSRAIHQAWHGDRKENDLG